MVAEGFVNQTAILLPVQLGSLELAIFNFLAILVISGILAQAVAKLAHIKGGLVTFSLGALIALMLGHLVFVEGRSILDALVILIVSAFLLVLLGIKVLLAKIGGVAGTPPPAK